MADAISGENAGYVAKAAAGPPTCSIYNSGTQVVNSGAANTLLFDTIDAAGGAGFVTAPDGTGANSNIKVVAAGRYDIWCFASGTGADDLRDMEVSHYLNGALLTEETQYGLLLSSGMDFEIGRVIPYVALPANGKVSVKMAIAKVGGGLTSVNVGYALNALPNGFVLGVRGPM